jgi:hypothetical protein
VSHAFFFLASLAWNLGLGMTWLAVPLYAYSQGLSNAQIGVLFAARSLPRRRSTSSAAPIRTASAAGASCSARRSRP